MHSSNEYGKSSQQGVVRSRSSSTVAGTSNYSRTGVRSGTHLICRETRQVALTGAGRCKQLNGFGVGLM